MKQVDLENTYKVVEGGGGTKFRITCQPKYPRGLYA